VIRTFASLASALRLHARELLHLGCVVTLGSCAVMPPVAPGVDGKPIGEFFDELKAELRDVHWRVRSDRAACGTPEPREIDLRNATITLELSRIGEASVDGEVKLVALPLAGSALTPLGSAAASRKWTQEILLKLDVAGPSRLYTPGEGTARGEVARTINAAIDGFVRSSADEPCVRLSSLRLTVVIDVRREAGGGFRLAVPGVDAGVEATRRDVNTLTLSWDKVLSNALR
jgi:hypothetical protein